MDLSAALHHFRHPHPHPHPHPHQEMGSHSDSQSLDSMIAKHPQAQHTQQGQQQQDSKKPKPPDSEPQKCPRCDSTNTKFCYYNNYSLSQPRYFCKSCRRYWTKGGTLRNVPVGGGCRRNSSNKRSSSPSHSFSATSFLKRPHAQDGLAVGPPHNPLFSTFGGGLGLGFGFDHPTANVSAADFDTFLGHPHLINPIDHYGFGSAIVDDIAPLEVKQQMSIENKGLWGYHQPWQVINNGDYSHGGMGYGVLPGHADLEPIKETWNGLIGNPISTWQAGLLNTPALM